MCIITTGSAECCRCYRRAVLPWAPRERQRERVWERRQGFPPIGKTSKGIFCRSDFFSKCSEDRCPPLQSLRGNRREDGAENGCAVSTRHSSAAKHTGNSRVPCGTGESGRTCVLARGPRPCKTADHQLRGQSQEPTEGEDDPLARFQRAAALKTTPGSGSFWKLPTFR